MADRKDVVQGTLDLLVLRIIATQPMHGWGVMQRLRHLTNDVFQVTPGSLFPALHRLEAEDLIVGEWSVVDGRRIKSYSLTTAGRRQLTAETKQWERIVAAVSQVLRTT